ncbi:MAG: PilZ domain-containing protein [Desulfosudaceae bacterium]
MTTDKKKDTVETPPENPEVERREHLRRPVRLTVTLAGGQVSGPKKVRDLSLGGIFVETKDDITPGQALQISIPFTNHDRRIRLKGKVVRVCDDGIGIQFDIYSINIE